MFVCHSQRVPVKGDAATAALDVGRVDAEEEGASGGQPPGQQLGTPGSDVDQQLVLWQCKHLHVEFLPESGAEPFNAVNLQTVLSLVRKRAVAGWIWWTWALALDQFKR